MKRAADTSASSGESARAFTIIELLVAASLTLLIAAAIVTLMVNTVASWNRSHGALTAEGQARQALDQIERDLQGALCREDGNVWFAATVQASASVSADWVTGSKPAGSSLSPAAADFRSARFGVAGVWLRFFTAGGEGANGDLPAPVAVSYQIVRRAPASSGRVQHYLLYRAEMTAADTFAAGFNLGAASYDSSASAGGPGKIISRPGALQVLADNVIDFGVRFYDYVPDTITDDTQLKPVFPTDAADLEFRVRSSAGLRQARLPAVMEVLVRVLTPEGARRIAALEVGRVKGDWWEIAAANSKVFTRRIRLPTAAL